MESHTPVEHSHPTFSSHRLPVPPIAQTHGTVAVYGHAGHAVHASGAAQHHPQPTQPPQPVYAAPSQVTENFAMTPNASYRVDPAQGHLPGPAAAVVPDQRYTPHAHQQVTSPQEQPHHHHHHVAGTAETTATATAPPQNLPPHQTQYMPTAQPQPYAPAHSTSLPPHQTPQPLHCAVQTRDGEISSQMRPQFHTAPPSHVVAAQQSQAGMSQTAPAVISSYRSAESLPSSQLPLPAPASHPQPVAGPPHQQRPVYIDGSPSARGALAGPGGSLPMVPPVPSAPGQVLPHGMVAVTPIHSRDPSGAVSRQPVPGVTHPGPPEQAPHMVRANVLRAPAVAGQAAPNSSTSPLGATRTDTTASPTKRVRRLPWSDAAATAFVKDLKRPTIASEDSNRPHRDIKGWIVRLLDPVHAPRWEALADAAAHAKQFWGTGMEEEDRPVKNAIFRSMGSGVGDVPVYGAANNALPAGKNEPSALVLNTSASAMPAAELATPDEDEKIDEEIAVLLARAIMERVIERRPGESKRIATSNARRQCVREKGRLTLVRLVDLALALRNLRKYYACIDIGRTARAFHDLTGKLHALRSVNEMDDAANAVESCLLSGRWAAAYGGIEARAFLREAVLRGARNAEENDFRVLRGDYGRLLLARGDPTGPEIFTAAMVADFDKKRALSIADRVVGLTEGAVTRIRHGESPLPLKHMRMVLFCQAARDAAQRMSTPDATDFIVRKLATLFVPKDWHSNIRPPQQSHDKTIEYLESPRMQDNQSAVYVKGMCLMHIGRPDEAKFVLEKATKMGDVSAPIDLGVMQNQVFNAPDAALKCYKNAIERGSARAALNSGDLLQGMVSQHWPYEGSFNSPSVSSSDNDSVDSSSSGSSGSVTGHRMSAGMRQPWLDTENYGVPLKSLVKVGGGWRTVEGSTDGPNDANVPKCLACATPLQEHADTGRSADTTQKEHCRTCSSTKEAIRFYELASQRGNALAALRLAAIRHFGAAGEKPKLDEARRYYELAQEQGSNGHLSVGALAREGMAQLLVEENASTKDIALAKELCLYVLQRYGPKVGVDADLLPDEHASDVEGSASTAESNAACEDKKAAPQDDSVSPSSDKDDEGEGCAMDAKVTPNAEAGAVASEDDADALCLDPVDIKLMRDAVGGSLGTYARILHKEKCDVSIVCRLLEKTASLCCKAKGQALFDLGLIKLDAGDPEKAFFYFKEASDTTAHTSAPNNVGMAFLARHKDAHQAFKYFKLGARRGDARSALHAGNVCADHLNDVPEAVAMYERAIELGNALAPARLAMVLLRSTPSGRKVRRRDDVDTARVASLRELAVRRGCADAKALAAVSEAAVAERLARFGDGTSDAAGIAADGVR